MSGYDKAIQILTQGERRHVWSLVVTIFGDLARDKGNEISAQTLAKLTDQIGVKSEALRVALHRLRKDGWIESRRLGRSRSYALTPFGFDQSQAAAPRIYGLTDPGALDWVLYLGSAQSGGGETALAQLEGSGAYIRLGNHALLGPRAIKGADKTLLCAAVECSKVPEWVKIQIFDANICASYAGLFSTLQSVRGLIPASLSNVERAVLRTLIVHSWRRVLLRHPDVPDAFCPKNCKAIACRQIVLELLDRLPRPLINALE